MSKGYHLLFLPVIFLIIVPITIFSKFYIDWGTNFHFYALMILSSILTIWNIIELQFAFIKRKGQYLKLKNALRNKMILKYATVIYFGLFVGCVGILEFSNETDYFGFSVSDENLIKNILSISIFSMFFPLIPSIVMLMQSNYFKGKAFAYFTIGLNSKNNKKIDYYQNGIYAYNNFVSERYGMKLNHIDEMESSILTNRDLVSDNEITDLLSAFNQDPEIAKKICKIFNIPEKEIFVNSPPLESLDKLHKISFFIPIGLLIIAYLNYMKP